MFRSTSITLWLIVPLQHCRFPTLVFGASPVRWAALHSSSFACSRSLQLCEARRTWHVRGLRLVVDGRSSHPVRGSRACRHGGILRHDVSCVCQGREHCGGEHRVSRLGRHAVAQSDAHCTCVRVSLSALCMDASRHLPSHPRLLFRIRFVRTKWKKWRVHERHGQLPVRLTSMATWRILHGAHVRTCSTHQGTKSAATWTGCAPSVPCHVESEGHVGSTWQGRAFDSDGGELQGVQLDASRRPAEQPSKMGRSVCHRRTRCRHAWQRSYRNVMDVEHGEAVRANLRACSRNTRLKPSRPPDLGLHAQSWLQVCFYRARLGFCAGGEAINGR